MREIYPIMISFFINVIIKFIYLKYAYKEESLVKFIIV